MLKRTKSENFYPPDKDWEGRCLDGDLAVEPAIFVAKIFIDRYELMIYLLDFMRGKNTAFVVYWLFIEGT